MSPLHAMMQKLDTPCVLVDMERVDANIARAQQQINALGLVNRPHIKTHKIPELALRQLAAGAIGISCQKITEAEAFAAAGCDDILIPYNIIGDIKLARLRALAQRVILTVTVDSAEAVAGLSRWFAAPERRLRVLVECDTGQHRCGARRPDEAAPLARLIDAQPGLAFCGLLTYPPRGRNGEVNDWLEQAVGHCQAASLAVETVSVGGTPQMADAQAFKVATEYRPGTYIYKDRSLVAKGLAHWDDCALRIASTIVSRPEADLAIIDAGSKIVTTDLMGLEGYGHVPEYPDARLRALNEEHGYLDLSGISGRRPGIGEVISIIPNHACVVSNMVDAVITHSGGMLGETLPVVARGAVT